MAKIALLSDIHGNLPALKKVISVLEQYKPEIWICLGDIVGYGPAASECIKLIRELDMICVKGNHDAGVTNELTIKHFRNPNRRLIEQTKRELSNDEMDWLIKLPYVVKGENWIAAHATPEYPEKWEYLESAFRARKILDKVEEQFCFIGHTHKPAFISSQFGAPKLSKEGKFIINPGSVGQSRDGDYRASCAFLDTKELVYENYRLDFDLEESLTGLMKKGFSREEATQLLKV